MKKKSTSRSVSVKLRVLIASFVVLVGVFFVLFATANPSTGRELGDASAARGSLPRCNVTARTTMRVTPDGMVRDHDVAESKTQAQAASLPEKAAVTPFGNTV